MASKNTKNQDDVGITIRLKHGIHTIFLFVDPLAPFSKITSELLEVLRERYPDGLTTSIAPPKTTPIPNADSESAEIYYAVMKAPSDPSQGWRNLHISANDRPVDTGLKDNSAVAFSFQDPDNMEDDVRFEVEWPELDDDVGDAEA